MENIMIRAIHSLDLNGKYVEISKESPYLHKVNHFLLAHLNVDDKVWIENGDGYLCCKVDGVEVAMSSTPVIGPHFFSYRLAYSHRTPRGSTTSMRTIDMGHETGLYYIDILEVHKLLFPRQQLETIN